jgi:hypothetical protein
MGEATRTPAAGCYICCAGYYICCAGYYICCAGYYIGCAGYYICSHTFIRTDVQRWFLPE